MYVTCVTVRSCVCVCVRVHWTVYCVVLLWFMLALPCYICTRCACWCVYRIVMGGDTPYINIKCTTTTKRHVSCPERRASNTWHPARQRALQRRAAGYSLLCTAAAATTCSCVSVYALRPTPAIAVSPVLRTGTAPACTTQHGLRTTHATISRGVWTAPASLYASELRASVVSLLELRLAGSHAPEAPATCAQRRVWSELQYV